VIGPNSEQLGIMVIRRALEVAEENNLDLVEVAPTANPPVCRIMDFSKYKYDQEKKERKVKRHQHISQLKQIRVKPHIEVNDYQVKVRQAKTFLSKRDKVKINLFFRGREMTFKEKSRKILERFIADLGAFGQPEGPVQLEGRVMSVVILPNPDKSKPVKAESNPTTDLLDSTPA